jgi:hypothetical protein
MDRISSGRASATRNGAIDAAMRRAAERLPARLGDLVRQELEDVVQSARRLWPRDTSRSANSLEVEMERRADRVVGEVVDGEAYAAGIRFARRSSASAEEKTAYLQRWGREMPLAPSSALAGELAWKVLVSRPIRAALERVASQSAELLRELLRGA